MIKFLFGVLCAIFLSSRVHAYESVRGMSRSAITCVLVAEAYSSLPDKTITLSNRADPLLSFESAGLDTQVLLGDRLQVIKSDIKYRNSKWVEVKLLDQPTFKNGLWIPKICFMPARACSAQSSNWRPDSIVTSLVASVFAKPSAKSLQLGRLSMGTRVKIKKEISHGWVEVVLASGVIGCVCASDLVSDDVLNRWGTTIKRDQVVVAAKSFESSPYRWGCSSGFDASSPALTGVDCSGLIYLAYRTIGLHVPRDAHDQFLASSFIKFGKDVLPGDLIFIAKINSEKKIVRVSHVMMALGADRVLESTGLGVSSINELADPKQACTRIISTIKHPGLKKPLKDFWHGQLNDRGEQVFFGTFLGNKVVRSQLTRGLLR